MMRKLLDFIGEADEGAHGIDWVILGGGLLLMRLRLGLGQMVQGRMDGIFTEVFLGRTKAA